MGVVIDSCVLIDSERGRLDIAVHVASRAVEGVFISAVSASELLHGVHRASDAAQRSRRSAFVEEVLRRIPVLAIDPSVARAHARLWAECAAAGTTVPAHDLWIAATCVARGYTLVTANARDFERIPGLSVEVWR